MPIISAIGRKSPQVRLLVGAMYLALGLGAVTMVHPFLLMLAGTSKSGVDTPEARLVPEFLVDDVALFRKDLEGHFNENLGHFQAACDVDTASFRLADPPSQPQLELAWAWEAFLAQEPLPHYFYEVSYMGCQTSRQTMPANLRRFRGGLDRTYDGDLARLNREEQTTFPDWNLLFVSPVDYVTRTVVPGTTPFDRTYQAFKEATPIAARYYFSIDGFYRNIYLKTQYTKDIAAYNRAHGTDHASWDSVRLTPTYPDGESHRTTERADWEGFVRTILNLLWIRADEAARPPYQAYLQAKYRDIGAVNRLYGTAAASFADIRLPQGLPSDPLVASDWSAFLQGWKDPETGTEHLAPIGSLRIRGVDSLFREHLAARYGSLATLNAALGTDFPDWLAIMPPQRDYLYLNAFLPNTRALRGEFCVRNFIAVSEYILRRGRALGNTIVYVFLAILAALTVNPLAAYALSRYRPPSTYKVLLFFMMTMAFPPMVTQIPAFLMLRELGLLNSFAALILPGVANGYSIFLLKGFFDSLPRELYESAAMDGAGEIRIFLQITMSLSKPILAVIALGAFTSAYGNFMMALLICQDQQMWTLMPWLYQLQMNSGQGVVFASLVVASIPTFLVFSLCQNIIMRGIVVPVEK